MEELNKEGCERFSQRLNKVMRDNHIGSFDAAVLLKVNYKTLTDWQDGKREPNKHMQKYVIDVLGSI